MEKRNYDLKKCVKQKDLIYISCNKDKGCDEIIVRNMDEILKCCDNFGARFVYLPEVLSFNAPCNDRTEIYDIYNEIAYKYGISLENKGLLYFNGADNVSFLELADEYCNDIVNSIKIFISDFACDTVWKPDILCRQYDIWYFE